MKQKLKENDGYSTILFLVVVSVLLPVVLFFFVELGHIYNAKYQLEDITENAVQTGLYELDETSLAKGELLLDKEDAEMRVIESMEGITSNSGGVFSSYPQLSVEIEDATPSIYLKSASNTDGIFLSQFFDIESTSKKSISFAPKQEGTYTAPTGASLDGVSASITKIVHPLWYDNTNFPLGFGEQNRLAAFGNVEIEVVVNLPLGTELLQATYDISFEDPNIETISGSVSTGTNTLAFQVPSEITKETSVYLQIEGTVEKMDVNTVKTIKDLNGFTDEIGQVDKHLEELLQIKSN